MWVFAVSVRRYWPKVLPIVIVIVSQVHNQLVDADVDAILVLGRALMVWLGWWAGTP